MINNVMTYKTIVDINNQMVEVITDLKRGIQVAIKDKSTDWLNNARKDQRYSTKLLLTEYEEKLVAYEQFLATKFKAHMQLEV